MGNEDITVESIRRDYPPVLTSHQVSELLGLAPRTVMAMAADGRLKARRLPGARKYQFFREDIITALLENTVVEASSMADETTPVSD